MPIIRAQESDRRALLLSLLISQEKIATLANLANCDATYLGWRRLHGFHAKPYRAGP